VKCPSSRIVGSHPSLLGLRSRKILGRGGQTLRGDLRGPAGVAGKLATPSAVTFGAEQRWPKMLIGLEGAHAFYVSIFGGVEHLRADVRRCSEQDQEDKSRGSIGAVSLGPIVTLETGSSVLGSPRFRTKPSSGSLERSRR
jgi:hypothetical protein